MPDQDRHLPVLRTKIRRTFYDVSKDGRSIQNGSIGTFIDRFKWKRTFPKYSLINNIDLSIPDTSY